MKRQISKLVPALSALVLAGAAGLVGCRSASLSNTTMQSLSTKAMAPAGSGAALRSTLDDLLQQHVILAMDATDAALHGRSAEFGAAASALDQDSVALSKIIGSVYGNAAAAQFLTMWRGHIGYFVDFTKAVASNDDASKQQAAQNLLGYTTNFATFINSATQGRLSVDAVAGLGKTHVVVLEKIIEEQNAGDFSDAYTNELGAAKHMSKVAKALAVAISAQFPDKFDNSADSSAAALQDGLTTLLQEHVLLAMDATDAALHGRADEFKAAAAATDANSTTIAGAIGSIYGDQAEGQFLGMWRGHIGNFVIYTQGVAAGDQAKEDKANTGLNNYATNFGAFIQTATDGRLPKDAVAGLSHTHIHQLEKIINDQHDGDFAGAYTTESMATTHMWVIGDDLTGAFTSQFPDKFSMSPGM